MGEQSLGRVLPIYRGTYVHGNEYKRLDSVFLTDDGCSWICLRDCAGIKPADNGYWQKMAQKGDQGIQGLTGAFGTPTYQTETLVAGSSASVTVTTDPSSPDEAKVFQFDFKIPAGPVGYDDVAAKASPLPAGYMPTAQATLAEAEVFSAEQSYSIDDFTIYDDVTYRFIQNHAAGAWNSADVQAVNSVASGTTEETLLSFNFGIPIAEGAGAQAVDGETPAYNPTTGLQEITLQAVRFVDQHLDFNDSQKTIARINIGAQAAGSYLNSYTDTMNGTLSIKSADLTDGTIPETTIDGEAVSFTDSSNSLLGKIYPRFGADGTETFNIGSIRTITTTEDETTVTSTYTNNIGLAIDSEGTSSVILSNAEAWREALGVVSGDIVPAKDSDGGYAGETGAYARADHYHAINVSDDGPLPDGVEAAAGSLGAYARADHIHQINVSTSSDDVKSDSTVSLLGSSSKYARVDHQHPLNVSTSSTDVKADSSTVSLGSSHYYARVDHQHPLNVATSGTPEALGTASLGNATTYARTDHVHAAPAITALSGTLAIGHGGTGATTAANARTALGATALPVAITISLPSANWGSQASSNGVYYWSQTGFTVSGGTANSIIDLNPNAATLCGMVKSGTAAIYIANSSGTFTAYAIDAKPVVNLNNIPAIRWEKA